MLVAGNGLIFQEEKLEVQVFKMNYKEAVKRSMEMLSKKENAFFIGYNVRFGSRMYGTLSDVPEEICLEMPVAENLMAGVATGMSFEDYRPVLIFERQDFILNGLDSLVNHLDKLPELSEGQFNPRVIIRTMIGSRTPLDPGPQHSQDFTSSISQMVSFPVVRLRTPKQVLEEYEKARQSKGTTMLVEERELYGQVKWDIEEK